MPAYMTGSAELHALALRLKAAGDEGKGLKRALYKSMNEAVQPLAKEVSSLDHLKSYLPDHYAEVLAADLTSRISSSFFARNPRVEVIAKSRVRRRKVRLLDAGFINHPVFARGLRSGWSWSNAQTGGMRPGFFSDAVNQATPQIRDKVLAAMTETARAVTGG